MVGYQIYPKSFKDSNGDGLGDIKGIIEKLPYLRELGVDFLWINPIYKSPQIDGGYDISDFYAIDEMFGTLDDFQTLLKEAHDLDLKIMLDLVVNHTSDQHPWFIESQKSKIILIVITICGKMRVLIRCQMSGFPFWRLNLGL